MWEDVRVCERVREVYESERVRGVCESERVGEKKTSRGCVCGHDYTEYI